MSVLNPLRRPSLWLQAQGLAQYYASRDGVPWFVWQEIGAVKRPGKIRLTRTCPEHDLYDRLVTVSPGMPR